LGNPDEEKHSEMRPLTKLIKRLSKFNKWVLHSPNARLLSSGWQALSVTWDECLSPWHLKRRKGAQAGLAFLLYLLPSQSFCFVLR
jgi:hypothetical protein